MSTPVSRSEISFPWRCSRVHVLALAGIHLVLYIFILVVPFEIWVKILLSALVTANFLHLQRGLISLASVHQIGVNEGVWYLSLRQGTVPAVPWRPPLLSHWLVILYLKAAGRHWVIPILHDSLPRERFRSLRVYLNLHSEP